MDFYSFTFQFWFVNDKVRPDLADFFPLEQREIAAQVFQVQGVGGGAVLLLAFAADVGVLDHGAVQAGAARVGLADEVHHCRRIRDQRLGANRSLISASSTIDIFILLEWLKRTAFQ